ncbi:MAG: agmatinase [Paracoccaceae bacterium]|nr:agmatinase [Paracoccaceae bacterium]MDE2911656.1 agmatinase [Paracoccaceae bacterium]
MPRCVDPFFQPVSGLDLPRFAGVPSFMRLPHVPLDHPRLAEVELGIIGVPWDAGTTNRPGPRHGPRQLRDYSTMIRTHHPANGLNPFATANTADLGDVPVNPADIQDTMDRITSFFRQVLDQNILPVAAGGDHLVSLPVLRALATDGPVGMIHFDAHTDLFHSYFGGNLYTHGTPFRRAIEEGLLVPERVIQIGIRGTMYDDEDIRFGRDCGVTIITVDELFERGIGDVMAEARKRVGDQPTYCSFDIDFIDPAFAPGTGTPEIGGPNSWQAQQAVRGLAGVNLIGADLVEVSPPFDPGGGTAWLGISLLFEIVCVLATRIAGRRKPA